MIKQIFAGEENIPYGNASIYSQKVYYEIICG